jgi:hypothetical protein
MDVPAISPRLTSTMIQLLDEFRNIEDEVYGMNLFKKFGEVTETKMKEFTCTDDAYKNLCTMVYVLGYAHKKTICVVNELKRIEKILCGLIAIMDKRQALIQRLSAEVEPSRLFSEEHGKDGPELLSNSIKQIKMSKNKLQKMHDTIQWGIGQLKDKHFHTFAQFKAAIGDTLLNDMLKEL